MKNLDRLTNKHALTRSVTETNKKIDGNNKEYCEGSMSQEYAAKLLLQILSMSCEAPQRSHPQS